MEAANVKTVPFDGNVNSVPLLDVSRGNEPLKAEIVETISEIVDSGRFVGGPYLSLIHI